MTQKPPVTEKPPRIIPQMVQTWGRKKTALANATVRPGKGMIKVNGSPLELVEPQVLRVKVYEPLLLLGPKHFSKVDVRIRVKGGGYTAQIYAIRQALCKGIVAYCQKYVDENTKRELKETLLQYDKLLLTSDPRRVEPKKFGGRGARKRAQKAYR